MKAIALAAFALVSTLSAAFAITDSDIAPGSLEGKLIYFSIENGGAPFATVGSWSGSFLEDEGVFEFANISGDTVGLSTACSVTTDGSFTVISLDKFVEGRPAATLTLYTVGDVGHYEVSINGVSGVSLNGTFVFPELVTTRPKAEISVQQPKGTDLKDGKSKRHFGAALVGESGKSRTFTIKNVGTAPLKKLEISVTGADKKDFVVTSLKKGKIAAGASEKFRVTFKPKSIGWRKAYLHIASNDANESSFDIKLRGEGVGRK